MSDSCTRTVDDLVVRGDANNISQNELYVDTVLDFLSVANA